MGETICKSVLYINKVAQNLRAVKPEETTELLRAIKGIDLFFKTGGGRSRSALFIGTRGLKKEVLSRTDTGFVWRNIHEAAPHLERKFNKIGIMVNSGSGKTSTPKETVNDINRYVRETHSEQFTVCSVTSYPNSPVGKKSNIVVELAGREEKKPSDLNNPGAGIMGDEFEQGSLMYWKAIKEAVNRRQSASQIPKIIETEMRVAGRIIDRYLESDHYQMLVKEISSRHRLVVGGLGPGQEVAKMVGIRLFQINQIIGRNVFLAGPIAPSPMPGDVLLLISFSGGTNTVCEWADDYKRVGGEVFSIVGTEPSTLSEETTSYLIDAPVEEFYERAAFLLSPLPGGMLEVFQERGLEIPEKMIRSFGHTVTE